MKMGMFGQAQAPASGFAQALQQIIGTPLQTPAAFGAPNTNPTGAAVERALAGMQAGTFDPQENVRAFFGQPGFNSALYLRDLANRMQGFPQGTLGGFESPFVLSGPSSNTAVNAATYAAAVPQAQNGPGAFPTVPNPAFAPNPYLDALRAAGARVQQQRQSQTGLAKGFQLGNVGGLGAQLPALPPQTTGTPQGPAAPVGATNPSVRMATQPDPFRTADTTMAQVQASPLLFNGALFGGYPRRRGF